MPVIFFISSLSVDTCKNVNLELLEMEGSLNLNVSTTFGTGKKSPLKPKSWISF